MLAWIVIVPLQGLAVGDLLPGASLHAPAYLFFPAVVKALAAWMYCWWSVLYTWPTVLIQHLGWDATMEWSQLVELTLYLTSAPLTICFLEYLGLNRTTAKGL